MTNSSVKSISSYMLMFFLLLIPIKSVAADGQGYPGGGWINLQGPKPPVPGAKTYSEFWTTQSKHLIVSNSLVKISSYFTGLEYVECSYWYVYTNANGKESHAQGVQHYSIECLKVYLNGIPTSLTMQVGDVETIKWSYSPNNIDTPKLEWSSSNYNVVDVNSSGRIEAKGNGTAVITVKSNVCPTKYINVTVSGGTGIVYVSSISLSESNSTLNVGNTKQLTATVLPTNATDKSVTWSSSNSSVASVSSSGLVTAKAVGTATIACQANDGSGKSATCSITVKSSIVDPLSIVLPNYTENIKVGETITLTPTIDPSNATTTLTWESSNVAVATVTQNGVVKGLKVGESKITVTTHNGKSAYCYVKVADNVIYVTSISLNATSVTLTEGNTKQLEATVSPNNATNKTVTWSSDNTSVATVSSSGLVTAKSAGSATITCKAVDGSGKQATCFVTVKSSTVEPTGITISPSSKTITVGETFYASYTLTPSNATTTVTWSSDNSSIASVSSSGLVTGKKVGSTYINAKTSNGKTDWCKVTVEETSKPKLALSASPSGGSVEKGTKVYLTVKADGSNVYGCDIYYTLNGTTPTKSNTPYTSSGISINEDCTLKAIAYKDGYETSEVFVETYSITMTNHIIIATNEYHSLVVKEDGALWGWGVNWHGELGNTKYYDHFYLPFKIKDNVKTVATGVNHSMIVLNNGTLLACGDNKFGQLGDGTKTQRANPVTITDNVASVSASYSHTLIVKNDGSLWACGDNDYGQLGDGTKETSLVPIKVMDNVKMAVAGCDYSLVIKDDNTLWACGQNYAGQLADGTNIDKDSFIKVMENVVFIATPNCVECCHTMIIKTDGSLWACGAGAYGRLGSGDENDRLKPFLLMDGVANVSVNEMHTLIVKKDNTLWACGSNKYGQLGDGTTIDRYSPTLISSDVENAVAGLYHSLILKTDGSIWACGNKEYGQLGDGTTNNQLIPIQIAFGNNNDIAIDATNFPDEIFRNYLLAQSYGKDGLLSYEEIQKITELDLEFKKIVNLKGIEFFTALTSLFCRDNELVTLNVTMNTALECLDCSYNMLTSLNVSNNIRLNTLSCSSNLLSTLDVSKNSFLAYMYCNDNQLTTLDVSNNMELKKLDCSDNLLNSLDVSNNNLLEDIYCDNNNIGLLDVSNNGNLYTIRCSENRIRGDAMKSLISCLPTKNQGYFYVINDTKGNEENVCTKNDVKILKDKGWTSYYCYEWVDWLGTGKWTEYDGADDGIDIILSPVSYATFYSSDSAYKLPGGLSAKVVKAAGNGKLTYETIIIIDGSNTNIVPKGVPVMIESNTKQAGTYTLTAVESDATYTGTNLLRGSDEATTTTGDGYHYKLSYGKSGSNLSNVFGWYWGAQNGGSFQIEGHKAWLVVPKSAASTRGFTAEGDATDIAGFNVDAEETEYYDLQGRRIEKPTAKGVYIKNGKKITIK